MASHGKVLDLFDDRYLQLHDVVGNVEPLPRLVPYEQYMQNVITFRMDTNHDIFMALLQDFTERKALETGKELWTWCVQWEVDETTARQPVVPPHSPKKPRLESAQPSTLTVQPPLQGGAPPITAQPRKIDPELLRQEDMLRILVDIVQVNSTVVPNFIEFLYRWIDFYEGDGKALNAALYGEIPSLWDFEYHPVLVPEQIRKKLDEAHCITRDSKQYGAGDEKPKHANAEELTQNSPTKKMRQKPDLAAFERKAEESERLQYREVHFGIQPPKLNEPLPPLINIPRDRVKRTKYHVACFKSRQRAFYLLVEAGVTPQQMKDYNRCQTMSLRDTPPLKGAGGLDNYEKDAELAQAIRSAKEKHRAKQTEIAISNKLADEAQLAGRNTVLADSSGVPLIPVTLSNTHRPDMASQILRKIQQTRDKGHDRINIVPTPLTGKMKSKLFDGARDREALLEMLGPGGGLPNLRSANVDGRGPKDGGNGSASTDEGSNDNTSAPKGGTPILPRSLLPPLPTLPRLSLPPPRPPPVIASTRPSLNQQEDTAASRASAQHIVQNGEAGVESTQFASNTGLHASNMIQGASNPSTITGLASYPRPPVLAAPRPANTTVSPPQFSAQHPPPPPPGFENASPFTSGPLPPALGPPPGAPSLLQRLLAQSHAASFYQGLQNAGPTLLRATDLPNPNRPTVQNRSTQDLEQGPHTFSSSGSSQTLARTGMQRTGPSSLTLRPPSSPLSSLAPSLLATSPFTISHRGIPVQIYLPRVIVPANNIGPGGMKLGNNGCAETDAFLLGHTHPLSGKILLSRAVFLPLGVWANAQDRVRKGNYKVLESYAAPTRGPSVPHRAVYEKVEQAFGMMKTVSPAARERELTKRWRASRGKMRETERGAVWEGWAVDIDREIAMYREHRMGAVVHDALIDGIDETSEQVRRRKEIDELLETDEAWDYEDDEDVHMQG